VSSSALRSSKLRLTRQKSDQWLVEIASSSEGVRGAVGFRQIPGSSVFTTGQPTQDAAKTILSKIEERCPGIQQVVWICLREEPLVVINGRSADFETLLTRSKAWGKPADA
jgi:hypothetical protein